MTFLRNLWTHLLLALGALTGNSMMDEAVASLDRTIENFRRAELQLQSEMFVRADENDRCREIIAENRHFNIECAARIANAHRIEDRIRELTA